MPLIDDDPPITFPRGWATDRWIHSLPGSVLIEPIHAARG